MAAFASVILLVAAAKSVSSQRAPQAPFFRTNGLDDLRADILSLASNGVNHAVQHRSLAPPVAPSSLLLPEPQSLVNRRGDGVPEVPARLQNLLSSTAPQLFETVIINGKHVTPHLEPLQHVAAGSRDNARSSSKGDGYLTAVGSKRDHGGAARHFGGEKGNQQKKKHYHESHQHGDSEKESKEKHYADKSGHKKSYNDGGDYGGSTHSQGGDGHKAFYKSGGHKGKEYFSKGYHGTHGKDEKKKHDAFYDNNHEEGKFLKFDKGHHNHGKEHYNKKGGKWEKSGEEKGSYKKGKENAKEHAEKDSSKHEKKGEEGNAYSNEKKYATSKATKGGKSYAVTH